MAEQYEVKQGDCLSSIAKAHGLRSWKVIWDDPNNKAFKDARKNPNVLYPGDVLYLPDVKPSDKKASATTEKRNKFQVNLSKTLLRIQVKDEKEKPLSGKAYTIWIGDEERAGKTDGDGLVIEKVDPEVTSAKLTVWLEEQGKGARYLWDLAVGHLDPIDEVSGIQARLNNLGYFCGDVDGNVTAATIAALKGFQKANGLEPTGEPDDDTKNKLLAAHGKS